MKEFKGSVLFLDRSDINTDEIIPARYLTEIEKSALQPHLLEDLKLDGFNSKNDIKGKSVIVTRENFGGGSSRAVCLPLNFQKRSLMIFLTNFHKLTL
jgi:3-isopropylmalate/(R)-2-methylmalate dehydratase small subunit